ncbi:MAG: EVE domain-containing protein [Ignavibacteria bacterium RIFOXYB2_FULL_35_12]|nr:MAG: EVE domain-containing protein [Ignavibacteria bacterium GWF2_35_20]OGU69974.1 MAG: EVE domain-containing protein [Stygiobacter sp. GWC2_38_9]OGU78476.1 MAG: EVE domain-containing protein [Ignavibacteria bacterium RIFOXYA2_FULL_35_9]OGU90122.1 MAG: EVE domain-containing protein [Ignavibacteria bacterium RIFOXYA12_FULL_35_25]OGU92111.1 MAG: EVE domain-containing protein [Ignavibacteria bacterium RIFOXYC12_FULL_35_11]OGU95912.1 MAG: EVE domain-containing protein [Ignavibacteria bacterium 
MSKFWLIKSEPSEFSIDDLEKSKNQTTYWDGVRNYQARNFIRDEMKIGDKVLFYHSNTEPNAVVGICEIVKGTYPDHTQFDSKNVHYDPKAEKKNPPWFMVDIRLEKKFKKPVSLEDIKANPKLSKMRLVQRGNRLSVMPVIKDEFEEILKMGNLG